MHGLDSKFIARVTGNPAPEIVWKFNDEVLNDSSKNKIKQDGELTVLFIRDCVMGDIGTYECVATNIDGEAKCQAKLLVVDEM